MKANFLRFFNPVKIFRFLKEREIFSFLFWRNKFWFLTDPLLLVAILINAKATTKSRENFFLFSYKVFRLQAKLNRLDFRLLLNSDIRYVNRDNFEKLKTSGRPILAVFSNHPTYLVHDHLLDQHPEFIGVTSHDFARPNTVLVKKDDKYLAYRVYKMLVENKFVAISFDGGYGNRIIKTKFLGSEIFLSRTYPFLVKNVKPIVVGFILRTNEMGFSEYVYSNRLFTDDEMVRLSEQEIIEKTIDYFTKDLIENDPHQINLRWFWERLKLGEGFNYPKWFR